MKFFILPKVLSQKILIWREGIKLLIGKEIRRYECEINTQKNLKVVEKTIKFRFYL